MRKNVHAEAILALMREARQPVKGPDGKTRPSDFRADNNVTVKSTAISINFIEVPDPEHTLKIPTTIITVSVMKNRRRAQALKPSKFGSLMGSLEHILAQADVDEIGFPYYQSLKDVMPHKYWCGQLDCHRMFMIPTADVFKVYSALFTQECVKHYNHLGAMGVFAVLQTTSHSSTSQFFCDEEEAKNHEPDSDEDE